MGNFMSAISLILNSDDSNDLKFVTMEKCNVLSMGGQPPAYATGIVKYHSYSYDHIALLHGN